MTDRPNRLPLPTALFLALLLAGLPVLAAVQATPPAPPPAAAVAPPQGAADGATAVLHLDPEKTAVRFTLGATLHTVEGRFRLAEGEVRFDPSGGPASGRIVVDATSGDTGNEGRDKKMHEKVLESATYPRIVLVPESLEGEVPVSGTGKVILHGKIEIHGGSHPVDIPTEVKVEGDELTATGTFSIPYVEWGMKDPSVFVLRVEKHIDVTVAAAGRLER